MCFSKETHKRESNKSVAHKTSVANEKNQLSCPTGGEALTSKYTHDFISYGLLNH